jgi:hypothetical protein
VGYFTVLEDNRLLCGQEIKTGKMSAPSPTNLLDSNSCMTFRHFSYYF